MSIVKVEGLVKKYPSFELKDVSFSLDTMLRLEGGVSHA